MAEDNSSYHRHKAVEVFRKCCTVCAQKAVQDYHFPRDRSERLPAPPPEWRVPRQGSPARASSPKRGQSRRRGSASHQRGRPSGASSASRPDAPMPRPGHTASQQPQGCRTPSGKWYPQAPPPPEPTAAPAQQGVTPPPGPKAVPTPPPAPQMGPASSQGYPAQGPEGGCALGQSGLPLRVPPGAPPLAGLRTKPPGPEVLQRMEEQRLEELRRAAQQVLQTAFGDQAPRGVAPAATPTPQTAASPFTAVDPLTAFTARPGTTRAVYAAQPREVGGEEAWSQWRPSTRDPTPPKAPPPTAVPLPKVVPGPPPARTTASPRGPTPTTAFQDSPESMFNGGMMSPISPPSPPMAVAGPPVTYGPPEDTAEAAVVERARAFACSCVPHDRTNCL